MSNLSTIGRSRNIGLAVVVVRRAVATVLFALGRVRADNRGNLLPRLEGGRYLIILDRRQSLIEMPAWERRSSIAWWHCQYRCLRLPH